VSRYPLSDLPGVIDVYGPLAVTRAVGYFTSGNVDLATEAVQALDELISAAADARLAIVAEVRRRNPGRFVVTNDADAS
jgi:hypothetical protein